MSTSTLNGLLTSLPVSQRLDLLRGQLWKHQVGKPSLPRQRLSFIECQSQRMLLPFQSPGVLSKQRAFHLLYLLQDFLA